MLNCQHILVATTASTWLEHFDIWIVDYIVVLLSHTAVILIQLILLYRKMITALTVVEPILMLLNRRMRSMSMHHLRLAFSLTLV